MKVNAHLMKKMLTRDTRWTLDYLKFCLGSRWTLTDYYNCFRATRRMAFAESTRSQRLGSVSTWSDQFLLWMFFTLFSFIYIALLPGAHAAPALPADHCLDYAERHHTQHLTHLSGEGWWNERWSEISWNIVRSSKASDFVYLLQAKSFLCDV